MNQTGRNTDLSLDNRQRADRAGAVEVVESVGLVAEFLAQPSGDTGDSVERNGRVLGETDIFAAGDCEPFTAVVGNGGERPVGNDPVEKAHRPGACHANELACQGSLGPALAVVCDEVGGRAESMI